MPSNGAAALPLELNSPSIPHRAQPVADKPDTALGEAVAEAAIGLCLALAEYREHGFIGRTRLMVGERAARVAMLQLAHQGDDLDFADKARAAAHPILRQLSAEYFRQHTSEQGDKAIDFWLDELFAMTNHVVATERAFVAAMTSQQRTAHHG